VVAHGPRIFTNSGSEAIEGALKLARIAARQKSGGTGKTRVWRLKIPFMAARLALSQSRTH